MRRKFLFYLIISISLLNTNGILSQHSIARQWNEQLLDAIRLDLARPTVHARNLFHSSVLMYDAWAIFDDSARTYFLGKTLGEFTTNYTPISSPSNKDLATQEVLSYAVFRLLNHRFSNSPNAEETLNKFESFFDSLGYDKNFTATDYSTGSLAALGNYMAEKMIEFGLQDGANESNGYENEHYEPVNPALDLEFYRDNSHINPNRWQPLAFHTFIDQSGNLFEGNTPNFLSPEWGEVTPFSLKNDDLVILNNGFDAYVYNNPGDPDYILNSDENGIDDPYKWNFALVISWSAHLDANLDKSINISPNSIGNVDISNYPTTFEEYKNFYDFSNGGDIGNGHSVNPITQEPYADNIVKKGDYARVLAEFWADGPDSETPPGHWFTILNYVSDHPLSKKTFGDSTIELSDLEWDVKSYLTLGGAMHDSAINIWGIKGYYDYVRPISAIRYMASKGQSSDKNQANYDPHGLPLIDGLIEVIKEGDELVGFNTEIIGQIKVKSWLGHDEISDAETDNAKVGWMLGTTWWPYQRPSFVSPPFAGYLSGHSAFSRAASEVLTKITNDAYFPGGMGTFDIQKNSFLAFEAGPSESFSLQWATYRDASDQTSLSRIWGGIHPPIDDVRARIIGDKIGKEAFAFATDLFGDTLFLEEEEIDNRIKVFPNPFSNYLRINSTFDEAYSVQIFNLLGEKVYTSHAISKNEKLDVSELNSGIYIIKVIGKNQKQLSIQKLIK